MKKIFSLLMVAIMAAGIGLQAETNTYHKVTTSPADWSGQYLIVYEKAADKAYLFNGVDAAFGCDSTAIVGDSIVADMDKYLVKIDTMTGGYSVQWMATGMYMSGTSNSNKLNFGAAKVLNTLSMSGVNVLITSNTSVLRFNKAKDDMRFRYYKASTYTNQQAICLYKAVRPYDPGTITYDTITVTEAGQRIEAGTLDACYVKGVVATEPTDPGSYGNTTCWLTDMNNPTDSIKGFKIAGYAGAVIATQQDIPFEMGDTVLFFANKLEKYNNLYYEINGGYIAEMLGEVQYTYLNDWDYAEAVYNAPEANKYRWTLNIQTDEDNRPGVAVSLLSSKEHGIAGKYTLDSTTLYYTTATDYVRIESGSLVVTYQSKQGNYNTYDISLKFQANGLKYRLMGEYEVPGYTTDYDEYSMRDDEPFTPQEGDTITCAQAQEYIMNNLISGGETEFSVYVMGYATEVIDKLSSGNQQSFWMDDQKGTTKTIEAFYCNIPTDGTKVKKDTKVLVYGALSRYNSTAEISNGQIIIIEGGEQPEERGELNYVEVPADAISVSEALAIGATMSSGDVTAEVYTVVGYIAKVAYQTANDSASWYMADTETASEDYTDFQAYKCAIDNRIMHNDYIFVTGKMSKFVGEKYTTIEISKGQAHFARKPTAIEEVENTLRPLDTTAPMYDVQGRQVDASYRGIVLQDGHKYLLY